MSHKCEIPVGFGVRLLQTMELKNMSQRDLSRATGLTPVTINRIVNELHFPDTPSLFKICDALDVSVEWMYDGRTKETVKKKATNNDKMRRKNILNVEMLIKKLQKCDPNSIVYVENDDLYINGFYAVEDVDEYEGSCYIDLNHDVREKTDDN